MSLPYVLSGQSLTFVRNGVPFSISLQNPHIDEIREIFLEALDMESGSSEQNDALDQIMALSKPAPLVQAAFDDSSYTSDSVSVTFNGTTVLINGEPADAALNELVMRLVNFGAPVDPYLKFIENLERNPSKVARSELFLWLTKANMPITADGHFLAYKKVKADFHDIYTGRFDYSPGSVVTMQRRDVDDDRSRTCSSGLHWCSQDYLPLYGISAGDRVVLVKIDPADVVSIPADYHNTKGRACKVTVLEDVTDQIGADRFNAPLTSDDGSGWADYYEYDDDYNYDDDEYGEYDDETADQWEDYYTSDPADSGNDLEHHVVFGSYV
jgi:hypothetical protein